MKPDATFEAVLQSSDALTVVLNPPGNSYELHLSVDTPLKDVLVGDRIIGTARARALRVHPATGGGAFIEPIAGAPRIVAGRVISNDEHGMILVRSAIPLLVELEDETDRATCIPGAFINFHVQSGTTFQPSPES
ncbi:MAG: hypothetical protein VX527_01485 [Planctomycetota bacterium]|nr:hypothetical protein [Planctomycetota bacterium]